MGCLGARGVDHTKKYAQINMGGQNKNMITIK